ncbi:MAG: hypothetical protein GX847_01880 [Clostridiales bacterium]|nr:hypothetical protein [Clostridiales bacterium]
MLYSTRIEDLRPDVAANCRLFVALMKDAGFKVQIVNTVRDEEKQWALYAQGVTKSKVPTFHSVKAGLAFDICQGVAGHGYDNEEFWDKAGEIGMKMGFEWGWNWKSFPEKPHFQWSAHGKYKGSDILCGRLPPSMPIFEKEDDMAKLTDEEFAEYMKRYLSVAGTGYFPSEWAQAAAESMKDAGIVNGDGQGNYGWQKPLTREAAAVLLCNMQRAGGLYGE